MTNIHRMVDMFWVIVAFVSAYYLKRHLTFIDLGGLSKLPNYYVVLFAALFVCFLVFNSFSLYSSRRASTLVQVTKDNLQVVLVSLLLLNFLLYLLHIPSISRIFFTLFGLLLFILLTISKIIIYKSLRYHRSRDYNTRNVMIVGTDEMARNVINSIKGATESGYKVLGCLEITEEGVVVGKAVCHGVCVIGSINHYQSHFMENSVDELIFATPALKRIENIIDIIGFVEKLGVNVRVLPDFQIDQMMYKPETARIKLEQFIGLPTISISSTPENESGMIIKSFIDYLSAIFGLLLLSPLFLVIAVLVKVTSPGPVFFTQERCGLYGRRFFVIKFRTMVENADQLKLDLVNRNEMDGPVFKIKDDPRITCFGKLLRRVSLDELPQLLNVLMGQMSLVGPRPPVPEEVEQYEPWQRRRLSMKPGLTCIWQVSGRNDIDFDQWMRMDLQYIDNWSLWLDCKILYKTIFEVLSFGGR